MNAWLRLVRVANLPTALANVLAGFLLAHGAWSPSSTLVILLIASACLFSAGMVLNDVFDVQRDREQRPGRPLASGAIDVSLARNVGLGLLGVGVGLAFLAGWKSGLIAILLAAFIWLYDGPLKRTAVAPFLMGGCRTLNILMVALTAGGTPNLAIWYAAAIGVFISGVTWVARNEAADGQKSAELYLGSGLVFVGLMAIAAIVFCPTKKPAIDGELSGLFPMVATFVFIPILRRVTLACVSQSETTVRQVVVSCLQSLILIDALVCLLIVQGRPVYSVVLIGLLMLTIGLKKLSPLT